MRSWLLSARTLLSVAAAPASKPVGQLTHSLALRYISVATVSSRHKSPVCMCGSASDVVLLM